MTYRQEIEQELGFTPNEDERIYLPHSEEQFREKFNEAFVKARRNPARSVVIYPGYENVFPTNYQTKDIDCHIKWEPMGNAGKLTTWLNTIR